MSDLSRQGPGPRARVLAEQVFRAGPRSEQSAAEWAVQAVQALGLPEPRLGRLRDAVAEAVRGVLARHGSDRTRDALCVRVSTTEAEDASMPQGWGFFLIAKPLGPDETPLAHHLIELILYLEHAPR